MITVGSPVTINRAGLPPGLRDSVTADTGVVQKVTWNQVFIVEVQGRKDPLLCDACDIAALTPETMTNGN